MFESKQGNILASDAEALVNTVNCVGVMGKGVALQVRRAFPECFWAYKRACEAGEVRPGQMHVFATGSCVGPKYIINFPTKRHWKGKSRLDDISAGLDALRAFILQEGIARVALPPLGCGNGGLDWQSVKSLIEANLAGLDGVAIELYEPVGAPPADSAAVAAARPRMTLGRAALLAVFRQYSALDYPLSRLEIQKLAYFLQEAGVPLRLRFVKEKYGPYADQLHKVMQRLEGHFIQGYGKQGRDAGIEVLEPALREAEAMLASDGSEARAAVQRVSALIEGFETPHGLELLSTVHWVAKHEPGAGESVDKALAAVKSWSKRKAETFPDEQLLLAWNRLQSMGEV